jgi:hypothetical protein
MPEHSPRGRVRARRSGEAGFTLSEALIAVAVTLVVVTTAVNTFTQSVSVADTSRSVSETNQTLQVGMSLMVRDLVQTGQGIPLGGIPLPSGAGSRPVLRPGPVNLALTFPAAGTTLPALSPGADLGPTVLGVPTDLITFLYADRTLALNEFPLVNITAAGDTITVDNRTALTGADGLRAGDLLLISNALGHALRMVTAPPNGQDVSMNAGDPLDLNQTAAAQGTILNLQTGPGVYPPTTATRLLMLTYYVDTIGDPAAPRLIRRVNAGGELAIARGVENLQLSYDLVDGTTNPTNVPTPPAANSPHQIRKVNLFLAARSLELVPTMNQFFRNSMGTQVGLRSLSFVDRYQ